MLLPKHSQRVCFTDAQSQPALISQALVLPVLVEPKVQQRLGKQLLSVYCHVVNVGTATRESEVLAAAAAAAAAAVSARMWKRVSSQLLALTDTLLACHQNTLATYRCCQTHQYSCNPSQHPSTLCTTLHSLVVYVDIKHVLAFSAGPQDAHRARVGPS
jgi:hypothetical protein